MQDAGDLATLIAGDGRRVRCSRQLVAGASSQLRRLLEQAQATEVLLPTLDGDTLETLVRVIAGEVALDLRDPRNTKLRAGAEVLGLLPPPPLALADLLAQVQPHCCSEL